jgi:phosphate starvation-inducible PhoH-like protein
LIPVVVRVDGDTLHFSGEREAVRRAGDVLDAMLQAARSGTHVTPDDVAFSARTLAAEGIPATLFVTQRGKEIRPKTAGQRAFVASIAKNTLTFGIGPAGTGKTFLAIVMAVRALKEREV